MIYKVTVKQSNEFEIDINDDDLKGGSIKDYVKDLVWDESLGTYTFKINVSIGDKY